jgi:hypothetical protein
MRPSLALSIGAAFNILFGLPLVLAPAQMLSAFGWPATPNVSLVPARDAGTVLIGVGLIDWFARDAVGAPLRGLLWGNIFIRVAAMAVNGWELAAGIIPTTALTAFGGLLVPVAFGPNIALIIMFALALHRGQEVG